MKQVLRFLALAALICVPWVTQGQSVTIGSGTATSYNVPSYSYYNYAISQQIYTAAEIEASGTITSISFYKTTGAHANDARKFDIYMAHTTKSSFASSNDWVALTDADLVYHATDAVAMSEDAWATFTLDNPFNYNGTDNLIVCVIDRSGNYSGSSNMNVFRIFSTGSNYQAIHAQGDSYSNLNPNGTNNSSALSYSRLLSKNQIILGGIQQACPKPTDLAAALTPGNGTIATLNWTAVGTETDWVVEYSTTADFSSNVTSTTATGTPTANLTGLTAETQYYAHVKADCGGGDESVWSTTVTFTPSNAYTITVNDGTTTNEYVPIYGYYCDNLTRSQFIIPATSLTAMQWGTINELTFYASNTSVDWGSAEFEVYVMETDETTLDALVDWTDMTKVMTAGSLSITGNQMVVTLTTPYHYQDGNLMIGFKQTVEDDDVHSYWYGVSGNGASMGGYEGTYSTSITQRNFLPKTTFSYTPGAAPACAKPTGLTYSDVTAHGVQLSWTDNNGGSVDQWQICLNGDEDHLVLVNANPYIFTTELEQDHDYAIKVRAYCAADEQSGWSNEVNIHTLVACAAPTALDVDNITAHTAELSWTSSADNFNIRYRTAADINFNVGDFTQVGTNYTAQDVLTPYLIDLSAYSGTGNIAIRHYNCTDNFYLNVDDIVLTNAGGTEILNENFESGDIPSSWIIIDNDADGYYWQLRSISAQDSYGNDVGNGNYCATSASYENSSALNPDNWLIIPNVELGGTLTFVARGQDPDWPAEVFGVYVSTNVVATPAGAWQNTTSTTNGKDLDGLSSLTTYEWQVQADCGGETSVWSSGTFTTEASCFPVTGLAVDDITANTITLSWTDNNSGSATYVVTNTSDVAYTVTGLTATGCTVTNLDGNTSYTFKVKANCGVEGVSTAETITERTACAPIATLPYNEGFESAEEGFYCWDFNYFYRQYNPSYTHGGNTSIHSGSDNSYVVAPEMDEEISNLMLNFWWSNFDADKDYGTLHIGYVTDINDPATSFVDLYTIDMSTCSNVYVQSDNYVFTDAPAGARMALKYNSGANGANLYIDDVTIDERPACTTPISLTITGGTVTAHGATLAWTSEASAWQVQYRENGESTWLPNTPEGVTSATKIFTNLDPETSYDVRVRTDCGSSVYSDWVTLANAFTTLVACPAPTGLAVGSITNHTAQVSWTNSGTNNYNVRYRTAANITGGTPETFATSSTPTGWNRYTGLLSEVMGGTALTTSTNWSFSNYYVFPGDYHAKLNIYGTVCKHWLVTPETTLGSNAALGFDLALTDYSSSSAIEFPNGQADDRFVVLITTDDMATWTILREWNNSGSSYVYNNIAPAGQNVVIDLSAYNGETVKIAFYGESTVAVTGEDNDLHIDNVNIGTFVDASSWTNIIATTNSKTLTDLDAETQYDVEVQDVCGGIDGESTWSATTFTTDIPCATPTALAYSELKSNQVDLTWTETGTATDWIVAYKADADADFTEVAADAALIEGSNITFTLTGLTEETHYTVKVKANCEADLPGDGTSEWNSTPVTFTTLEACGAPTAVAASNVTDNSATISWTGDAPNFTVKYRIPAHTDGIEESFGTSSIPSGWTNMTGLLEDVMSSSASLASGSQWVFGNSNDVFDSHARINIYGSSSSERKGWLITPTFTLPVGATMSFDLALTAYTGSVAAPATTGTDDRFVVLVYAEGAWHILREWNNSGSSYVYNNISNTATGETVDDIDISAYEGKTVRFAFYGESTVSNADNNLHIDNVVIGKPVDASAWQSLDPTAATNNSITGLAAETKYEVVVVANCGDPHPVSNPIFFTTLYGKSIDIAANSWYAIASPVHNSGDNETVVGVDNLIATDPVKYDFLRYNEQYAKWESQKDDGFDMERGRGHIYRRSAATTLKFIGERNTGNITYYCQGASSGTMKGWNLIGNPYPHEITRAHISQAYGYLVSGYYTLQTSGIWQAEASTTAPIAVGQAILVKVTSGGNVTFSETAPATKAAPASTIAFTVSNDEFTDIAYARFSSEEGLPKISHLNPEAPMLSIDGYAIANLNEGIESFPMSFSGNGEYTLTVSGNTNVTGYLHLVDRLTGRDIDLLNTPSYSFTGSPVSDRFTVKLTPDANEGNSTSRFAIFDGNSLIVNGEGTLEVYDVMGRRLMSAEVTGSEYRIPGSDLHTGVYVLRMNGNSQKIVIK